ncbi:hypothetical protein HZS_3756, partial [Henneguya salminicola]
GDFIYSGTQISFFLFFFLALCCVAKTNKFFQKEASQPLSCPHATLTRKKRQWEGVIIPPSFIARVPNYDH